MAASLKPVLDIDVKGNKWKITSTDTFKTFTIEKELNKEFEEYTAYGRTLKVGTLLTALNSIKLF